MRTYRNPRYAPEFLERKLSPSAMTGGVATVALVFTARTHQAAPAASAPRNIVINYPPPDPMGPAGPA